jgi:hypothetical protein
LLAGFRVPTLFLAGAAHTLLLMVPLVVLLVFLTELFFELSARALPGARDWLPIIGFMPLTVAVLLRPVHAGLGTRADCDARYRHLGNFLLLALGSLLAVPALSWLGDLVAQDADWLFEQIGRGLGRTNSAGGSMAGYGLASPCARYPLYSITEVGPTPESPPRARDRELSGVVRAARACECVGKPSRGLGAARARKARECGTGYMPVSRSSRRAISSRRRLRGISGNIVDSQVW